MKVEIEDWERERMDGAVGVLSTVGPDGAPQAAPVLMRIQDGEIRFETEAGSLKFRNITRDPRVALTVHGTPKWAVVIRGRAEVVDPGDPGRQPQLRVVALRKTSWRKREG